MGSQLIVGSEVTRAPKAGELVAARLRRMIVRGELEEGATLPTEDELLRQFGVSRPTLREALRVLESENLIVVRRGAKGGPRVLIPDTETAARYAGLVLQHRGALISDIYDAQAALEPPVVGQLAATHRASHVKILQQIVNDETNAKDPASLLVIQHRFHDTLIELAGNETMRLIAKMLSHILNAAINQRHQRDEHLSRVDSAQGAGHRCHSRIVELIAAGEAELAEALWRKHIIAAKNYLLDGAPRQTVLDVIGDDGL